MGDLLQYLVVGLAVVAAGVFLVRRLLRRGGRGACDCRNCPMASGQTPQPKDACRGPR